MKIKITLALLTTAVTVCAALGIAACNGTNEIAAHDHVYTNYVSDNNATCTKDGTKTAVCDHDGCTETDTISDTGTMTGHSFTEGVCERCGAKTPSQGLEYTPDSDNKSYYVSGIGNCTNTDIVIADFYNELPVTSIGHFAFQDCTSIKSVIIGDGITYIKQEAFKGCTSLKNVIIGNGVTIIATDVFYDCTSLSDINIPNSVTEIGMRTFANCTSLSNITIPETVTAIKESLFSHCSSLSSIILPDGITSIENDAFYDSAYYNNKNNWENGVLYIGKYLIAAKASISGGYNVKQGTFTIAGSAFSGCTRLTDIIIPDSVTYIGIDAFCDTAFYSNDNNWENGVLYIGKFLIEAKNSISGNYQIKPGTVTIVSRAFQDCTMLESIIIPDSVTDLGICTFMSCKSLTSITIPNSVTTIGYSMFLSCSSLTSITIPTGVTYISNSVFYSCSELTDIYYNGTKAQWKAMNKDYDAWNFGLWHEYTVHCTDGDLSKEES